MDDALNKASLQPFNLINVVYDDEFVALINSLSSSIKDFFKSSRRNVSELGISLTSFSNQALYSKCVLSEIMTSSSYDKIPQLSKQFDNITDTKLSLDQSLLTIDKGLVGFFEEAKVIFKKMKATRTQKLDDILMKKDNDLFCSTSNGFYNKKIITSRASGSNLPKTSSVQKLHSSRENRMKSKNEFNELSSQNILRQSGGSNHQSRSSSPNYKVVYNSGKNNNQQGQQSSTAKLALNVIAFLEEMIRLQESIMKHSGNVAENKKRFEQQKNELKKLAENTLNAQGYNPSMMSSGTITSHNNTGGCIKEKEPTRPLGKIRDISQYEADIKALKSEIQGLLSDNSILQDKLKQMNSTHKINDNKHNEMIRSFQDEIKILKKAQATSYNNSMRSLENEDHKHTSSAIQLKSKNDHSKYLNEIQVLKAQLKENDQQKHALKLSVDELKKQLNHITTYNNIDSLRERNNLLQIDYEKKINLIEELREENLVLAQEKKTLQKQAEQLVYQKDQYDRLVIQVNEEIQEKKKALSNYEKKVKELQNKTSENAHLKTEIVKMQKITTQIQMDETKGNNQLKKEMDKNHQMINELKQKDIQLEKMAKTLKENDKKINDIIKKCEIDLINSLSFAKGKLIFSHQPNLTIQSPSLSNVEFNKTIAKLQGMIKTQQSEINTKNTTITQLQKDKSSLEKELELANSLITKHTSSNQILTNERKTIMNDLHKKTAEVSETVKLLHQQQSTFNKEKADLIKEHTSLVNRLKQQIDTGNVFNSKLSSENKDLAEQVKLLLEEQSNHQEEIENLKETIAISSLQLEEKNKDIINIKNELKYIKSLNDNSDELSQENTLNLQLKNDLVIKNKEINNHLNMISKLKDQIETATNVNQTNNCLIKQQDNIIKEITNQLNQEKAKANELQEHLKNKEKQNDSKVNSKEIISDLRREIICLQNDLNQSTNNHLEEKKTLNEEILQLHKSMTKLQHENSDLDDQLKAQWSDLIKEKQKLSNSLIEFSKEESKSKNCLSQINNDDKTSKDNVKKLESLVKEHEKTIEQMKVEANVTQMQLDNQMEINSDLTQKTHQLSMSINQLKEDKKTLIDDNQEEVNKLLKDINGLMKELEEEKEKLSHFQNQYIIEQDKKKELIHQLGLTEQEHTEHITKVRKESSKFEEAKVNEIKLLQEDKRELLNEITKLKKKLNEISAQTKESLEEKTIELSIVQKEYQSMKKEHEDLKRIADLSKEINYTPKTHTIITDKTYKQMTWLLMSDTKLTKDNANKSMEDSSSNEYLGYTWIPMPQLLNNISEYNQYKTDEEEHKEFTNQLQVNFKKLEQKEDLISKLTYEINKLKDQQQNSMNADINSGFISSSANHNRAKSTGLGLISLINRENNNPPLTARIPESSSVNPNPNFNNALNPNNSFNASGYVQSADSNPIANINNINLNKTTSTKSCHNDDNNTIPLEKFNKVLTQLNEANRTNDKLQREMVKVKEEMMNKSKQSSIGVVENRILSDIDEEGNHHSHRSNDSDDTQQNLETQLKFFKKLYTDLNVKWEELKKQLQTLIASIQISSKNKGIIETILRLIEMKEEDIVKVINGDKKKGWNLFKK